MVWLDEVILGWWLGIDDDFQEVEELPNDYWLYGSSVESLWVAASGLWRATRT